MDNYYILEFSNSVPYEACWTETHPVLFNGTKEELQLEFEIAVEECHKKGEWDFNFSNLGGLDKECFGYKSGKQWKYSGANFYTFEEWCKEHSGMCN